MKHLSSILAAALGSLFAVAPIIPSADPRYSMAVKVCMGQGSVHGLSGNQCLPGKPSCKSKAGPSGITFRRRTSSWHSDVKQRSGGSLFQFR